MLNYTNNKQPIISTVDSNEKIEKLTSDKKFLCYVIKFAKGELNDSSEALIGPNCHNHPIYKWYEKKSDQQCNIEVEPDKTYDFYYKLCEKAHKHRKQASSYNSVKKIWRIFGIVFAVLFIMSWFLGCLTAGGDIHHFYNKAISIPSVVSLGVLALSCLFFIYKYGSNKKAYTDEKDHFDKNISKVKAVLETTKTVWAQKKKESDTWLTFKPVFLLTHGFFRKHFRKTSKLYLPDDISNIIVEYSLEKKHRSKNSSH